MLEKFVRIMRRKPKKKEKQKRERKFLINLVDNSDVGGLGLPELLPRGDGGIQGEGGGGGAQGEGGEEVFKEKVGEEVLWGGNKGAS